MGLDSERLLTRRIPGNVALKPVALLCGAACAAFLLCAARGAAQTSPSTTATAQASVQEETNAAAAIPSYPDSPEGLQNLIKNMMKLEKKGDAKGLAPYVQSLILPNPSAWFAATFGVQIGEELTADYDRIRIDLPLSFPDMLAELESKHAGSLHATRFTSSCDPNASDTEYPLLLRRENAEPMYDVRFGSGSQYFTVRYFAYVDGAFRWLGSFKLSAPEFSVPKASAGPPSPAQLKVGGRVMQAKLIKQVVPHYPEDAKYHHVQGTVILHALIDTDGDIQDLQVLQGTCSLAQAAMKAVQQWQYSPTMVNGEPVRVDTTISVVFTLGG